MIRSDKSITGKDVSNTSGCRADPPGCMVVGVRWLCMTAAVISIATISIASGTTDTLTIFGNANMDDRIDESDVSYVEGILNGTSQSTKLADANLDGTIDLLDADQIKKMIGGEEKEITVLDAQNRNVTLKLPIKRAIGVNTGAIEIARAIGVDIKGTFAGASSYAIANKLYWPELEEKASIVYGSPDYELIANLKADLVILYKNPNKDESAEKFEAIGVPVIFLDCFNQEGLDGSIKTLGMIFGKARKADELIDWYHGYKDQILKRTEGLSQKDRPKTLFYFAPDYYYPSVRANTGLSGNHIMIVDAGGINIARDLNSSKDTVEVDSEWIMSQNPDVIIGSVNAGEGKSGYSANETAPKYMKMVRDKLLNDSAINSTKAGKDGKIFIICTDLNRGPMQAAGTALIAKILHPDLFKDMDPDSILKEYFEKWQGIPYRGYYAYPSVE